MLGQKDAMATVAVKKIKVAREFYEVKLGLKITGAEEMGVLAFKSGGSTILVYESRYAGTNQATAVTWVVGENLDQLVKDLKAKGITFEHYDMPGVTRQGDIHVSGKIKNAWFKDPDGNILSIVNG